MLSALRAFDVFFSKLGLVFFIDFLLDRLYFKWQKFADIDHTLDKEGNENDGNDEDDGNTTGHFTFNPYYNSTSGPLGDQHKMTTMNREGEKAPEAAETFFIDGDSLEKSRITMVNLQLEGKFSEHGKNSRSLNLVVGKDWYRDKVVVGRRGRNTPLFNLEGVINPQLSKETFQIFGPSREELIAEKEKEIKGKQISIQEIMRLVMMRAKIEQQENEHEKRWLRKQNSLIHFRMREENLKALR